MTQVLYAALAGHAAASDLYTVDPVTAVMTSIGPIGFACSGLAVDPTSGFLYGSTSNNSASHPAALISIDTSTGAGTLIGDFAQGAFHDAHDIAFDATGQLWGYDSSGGDLWQIDKATGVVTVIGGGGRNTEGALAFDSGGLLWWVGRAGGPPNAGTLDTSTGAYTQISVLSDGNNYHSGKFDSLDTLWASGPGGTGSAAPNLVTIDPNTGVVTPVAAFSVPGVGGLAWAGLAPPPIQAKFSGTPLSGFAPLVVAFTDLSRPGPSGPITGWAWDFGDGGTSSAQNPPHTYTTPGHYTVALTVTGTPPDGTDSTTKLSYIRVFDPADYKLYAALAGPATTSDLYEADPATGALTPIGPIGCAISGMAYDPTSGDIYGAVSNKSANHQNGLVTIDRSTGAATVIVAPLSRSMHDIAFDAAGNLHGVDHGGQVCQIDKTTGAVTGGFGGHTFSGGVDFDSAGVFWKVGDAKATGDNIVTLNPSNGAFTGIARTSDNNAVHGGKFDPVNVFWATGPRVFGQAGANLETIDPNTGTVTVIGAFTVPHVGALVWVNLTPSPNFSVSIVPSSINVVAGLLIPITLNTTAHNGDTETITLSYTGAGGITLSFDTNPITAGDSTVVHVTIPGVISPGVYTIPIHCVGTDNSHDVTLTVHVFSSGTAPGTHIAS